MSEHYKIAGPALISFSGGRTSAYMLHEIVSACGGALPPDVHVLFANTGKERHETLRFVHDCGQRWGVRVRWLEWRDTAGFEEVGFNSASRMGEPFAALIAKKRMPPNWQARFCTAALKVAVMHDYMRAELGLEPGQYTEVIGLRSDEGHRIFKGLEAAERNGRTVVYPLARNKIVRSDVTEFWAAQPFDLALAPHEGNCDLCFLKGRGIRKHLIRDDPKRAEWWIEQERLTVGFFDRRDLYADLLREALDQLDLFDVRSDDEHDAECGLHCASE